MTNHKTVSAPDEWLDETFTALTNAKKKVATKLYKKYGETVPFPMFLHLDLCHAMDAVYRCAPNNEEAHRFIQAALDEVFGKITIQPSRKND